MRDRWYKTRVQFHGPNASGAPGYKSCLPLERPSLLTDSGLSIRHVFTLICNIREKSLSLQEQINRMKLLVQVVSLGTVEKRLLQEHWFCNQYPSWTFGASGMDWNWLCLAWYISIWKWKWKWEWIVRISSHSSKLQIMLIIPFNLLFRIADTSSCSYSWFWLMILP